jgi:hypothetical protein
MCKERGMVISKTACNSLRARYKNIYILFDNDELVSEMERNCQRKQVFTNIVLPKVDGAKDISDVFHKWQDKEKFRTFMLDLFKNK